MKYTFALLAAALLGLAVAPAAAQAQSCVGQRAQSIFGTIESVHGNYFTLRSTGAAGQVNVYTQSAQTNYNGESLARGVYAGVWGCMTAGDRAFVAEKITLASSAQTYPRTEPPAESGRAIEGRITEIRNGQLLLQTGGVHGYTWVTTNQGGFNVGQIVDAEGYWSGGRFIASNVMLDQIDNNATNVEGQIREIQAGRVLVQSHNPHGFVWILTNQGGLRVGQTIDVNGRFNANRQFVASTVSIQQ